MALSSAVLIAFQVQPTGLANNKSGYYVHSEMLKDIGGTHSSCNLSAAPHCSIPKSAICLINDVQVFSVKINNFNIVFHQKLFVPCLWVQEKLL